MIGKSALAGLGAVLALTAAARAAETPAGPAPPGPAIIQIGSAYIAKQMCSCLFVAGRPETSCRAEFKGQIEPFTVTVDRAGQPATSKVTAALASTVAEANYDRRYGCTIAR